MLVHPALFFLEMLCVFALIFFTFFKAAKTVSPPLAFLGVGEIIITILFFAICVVLPGRTTLMSDKGKVVGHIPAHYVFISTRLITDELQAYDPKELRSCSAENKLSLMVNDPILRTIHYSVVARVGQSDRELGLAIARFGEVKTVGFSTGTKPNDKLDAFVMGLTYDFNQHHGDELKGFFNPQDQIQQAAFLALIHRYFDQVLQSYGLVLDSATFTIE